VIKLGFGLHQQGREFDVRFYSDWGTDVIFYDEIAQFQFLQVSPQYQYRINSGKFRLPVEIGLNINKTTRVPEIRFTSVDKLNLDLRLGTGVEYQFSDHLAVGLRAIYHHALTDYQDIDFEDGIYRPRQTGLEVSLIGGIK
jgi:hypothetical protein